MVENKSTASRRNSLRIRDGGPVFSHGSLQPANASSRALVIGWPRVEEEDGKSGSLFLSPLATGGKGWLLVTGRCRFVSARAPPHSRKLRSSPFSSFLHSSVSLLSFRFLFRREQCRFPVAIVREERSIFFLPSPLCRRFRETSLSPTEWPLTVTGTL